MIDRILYLVFLTGISVEDIRYRKISFPTLAAGWGLTLVYGLCFREAALPICFLGAGIGGVFLGLSSLTKGAFGYGDSMIICMLGVYLGAWKLLFLLTCAFAGLGAFAVILLAKCKWNRKTAFPAIPFLTVGYVALVLTERIG